MLGVPRDRVRAKCSQVSRPCLTTREKSGGEAVSEEGEERATWV